MTEMIVFSLATFAATYSFFSLLLKSVYLKSRFAKLVFVPSQKSKTGAILLGGIPIAFGSAVAVLFSPISKITLLSWMIPAMILTIFGYIDDKFEIRARYKLLTQIICIVTFAGIFAAGKNADVITFYIICFWGLGVINGVNLLDGIDTYSIKHTVISYLSICLISYSFGFHKLAFLSFLFSLPMIAFYKFNKYPSKVHLGEIGGGILGLNILYLSSELYLALNRHRADLEIGYRTLLFAFSFMHLPMTETVISLLRRAFKGKAPFQGDKLHLHHLLTLRSKMNPAKAATILGLLHFNGITLNLLLYNYTNEIFAFLMSGLFYVSYYLYFGWTHWSEDVATVDLGDLFTSLGDDSIYVYDASSVNDISFDFDYFNEDEEKAA